MPSVLEKNDSEREITLAFVFGVSKAGDMETNEPTAAEIAVAQAEADRYADYVEQKDRVNQAEEAACSAERQFFALGETPGDLAHWRKCIAITNRERAKLRAIGH